MAPEASQDESADETAEAPRAGRGLLFAGVAAAGLLGVGLGLWARPSELERHPERAGALKAIAQAAKPTRSLEIVVDDRPAEIGGPIQVLTGGKPSHFAVDAPAPAPAEADPEPITLAPRRPPGALIKAQAIQAPEPEPAEPAPPAVKPAPAAKPVLLKAARAAAKPAKVEAKTDRPGRAEKARTAEPKLAKAKVERRAEPRSAKLVKAKVEKPAAKPAKAEVRTARAERAAKSRLAAAEARLIKAESKAKPKISALLHAIKVKARPEPKAAPAKPLKAPRTQLAAVRPEKKAVRPKVERAVVRPATPKAPAPARLTKVASRCASSDPGAAVVCADPSLGAADRELTRAYRQAEAAGVPAWRLQQQQQRWLAARANAAREAPWAVRDVYQARIAELHDQARSAQSDY